LAQNAIKEKRLNESKIDEGTEQEPSAIRGHSNNT